MATLETRDATLYYEIHGEGPPLLLVAGMALDSQTWLLKDLVLAGTAPCNSRRNNMLFAGWASTRETGAGLGLWFRGFCEGRPGFAP